MSKRSIINSIYSNNANLSNSKYTYNGNTIKTSRNAIKRRVIRTSFIDPTFFENITLTKKEVKIIEPEPQPEPEPEPESEPQPEPEPEPEPQPEYDGIFIYKSNIYYTVQCYLKK
jgi:hypothetical protein